MRALIGASAIALAMAGGAAQAAVTESFDGYEVFNATSLTAFNGSQHKATVTGSRPLSTFNTEGAGALASDLKHDSDLGTGAKGLTASTQAHPQGGVLVLQQKGAPIANDNAKGGWFQFSWAKPVNVTDIRLLDIDVGETATFTGSNGASFTWNGTGNGELAMLSLAGFGFQQIDTLRVALSRSGALASVTVTPIPGAVLLLAPALAGLGFAARRRKATLTPA